VFIWDANFERRTVHSKSSRSIDVHHVCYLSGVYQ